LADISEHQVPSNDQKDQQIDGKNEFVDLFAHLKELEVQK